jgi:RHS repeat-associated protein
VRSGVSSFYHADAQGTITSLSNTTGALVQTYGYDSFGKVTSSSGSLQNSFQYTSREFDPETNLHFYRSRYYDPQIGRFLSEDPIAFLASLNFYVYAFNSPVYWVDPFGLDVTIKLYPASNPYGHVGIGVNSMKTEGFYPDHDAPAYPGHILPDTATPLKCMIIHTTPQQDQKIQDYINSRKRKPGWWRLPGRDCSNFVHDALKAGGVDVDDSSLPPKLWSNLDQLPHQMCSQVTPIF